MHKYEFQIHFTFQHPSEGFKKSSVIEKADDVEQALSEFYEYYGELVNLKITCVFKRNNPTFNEELKAEMQEAIEKEAKGFGAMIKALDEYKSQSLHDYKNWEQYVKQNAKLYAKSS